MKIASAFAVITYAFFVHASTVADVLTDIAKMNTDYTNWNAKIVSFPNTGGTLAAALDIHTAAGPIVSDTNTATTDTNNVTPLPIPVADGISILSAFSTLLLIIDTTINNLLATRAILTGFPIPDVPALIKSDLSNLSNATQDFEAALILIAPAPLQPTVSSLLSDVKAAIATAISAYS